MKDEKNKCDTYSEEISFLCRNDSDPNCWPERRPTVYGFAGGNWKMLTHVSAPQCAACLVSVFLFPRNFVQSKAMVGHFAALTYW